MSERCTRCGCHPPLCECERGAASRSEQSAGTIDVCSCGDCDGTPHSGSEGHLYSRPWPAAEAAQSPQVGAAHETLEQWAQNIANVTGIAPEARESVRLLALQLLHGSAAGHYCGAKWKPWPQLVCSAKHAEPGRSVSDRPPVNPPVASADPELAALLREARNAIDELHGMYAYADLLTGIDSALSRLAGPGK
jgi:hypothetical protein